MRRSLIHSLTAAAVLAVAVPAAGDALFAQGAQAAFRRPPPANAFGSRDLVCRGATVPEGWILVDGVRDRGSCSGDNPAVLRTYNVWVIERFADRPVGTEIEVCAAAPTPSGWDLVDLYRRREICGQPEDAFDTNVKRIRRVR